MHFFAFGTPPQTKAFISFFQTQSADDDLDGDDTGVNMGDEKMDTFFQEVS